MYTEKVNMEMYKQKYSLNAKAVFLVDLSTNLLDYAKISGDYGSKWEIIDSLKNDK